MSREAITSKEILIIELAEILGVTPAIIRSWQNNLNFNIPKDDNNEWIYDQNWQNIFKQVSDLRKLGNSFSQISEQISGLVPQAGILPKSSGKASKRKNLKLASTSPTTSESANDSDIKSFSPPPITSKEEVKVVRSNVSEKDILGLYGPHGEEEEEKKEPEDPLAQVSHPKNALIQENAIQTLESYQPMSAFESVLVEKNAQPIIPWSAETISKELQLLEKNMVNAVSEQDIRQMMDTYTRLVESYQALASRYSESSMKIGELEQKNKDLESRIEEGHSREQELKDKDSQEVEQLRAHVGSLKKMLEGQDDRLSKQSEELNKNLITSEHVDAVKKEVRLLTLHMMKQEEERQQGFFAKLKALFSGK